jgi:hypothetical protein
VAKDAFTKIGAVALLFGTLLIGAVEMLPVFGQCRILYRTHQSIHDSETCRIYQWLGISGVVLFLIAVIVGFVVAFRHLKRRSSDT